MKKISILRGIGILTLAAVFMFALVGCGDSDEGGGNDPQLPSALKNTNWIHTDGDKVQFGTNTVTVIPTSGSSRTFTLKSSTTVSELSRTTLYFGDSQTADFIVYQNDTINSVGLGGVQRTGGWSRDTGGNPQPNQCTITFNADGGTVSPASKQVNSGSPAGDLPVPTNPPSFFGGWYTAQNGGGTLFTSATIVTTSITVYAKWESTAQPVLFTITFDAAGGTVTPANKQVNSGSPAGDLPVPEKSPSFFGGWYTGQNGGGTVFTSATIVNASLTVYAHWVTATDINNLASFLSAQSGGGSANNPVTLPITIQLTEANWKAILTAIKTAGKYVALDLSTCSQSTTSLSGGLDLFRTFNPLYSYEDGKDHITSLILPNAATSIASGSTSSRAAFRSFSQLTSVSALAVTEIGSFAFYGCTSLVSVSALAVTNIDSYAFEDCTSLVSVSFPVATYISHETFRNCTSLVSVSFPMATYISHGTFRNCTSLTNVNIPTAIKIEYSAFEDCTSLTSISFPAVTEIGAVVFRNCTSLTSVSFPMVTKICTSAFEKCTSLAIVSFPVATTIEGGTFWGCTSLANASLPAATIIGAGTFGITGTTALTITLGLIAPTLENTLFAYNNSSKTVTVKVPSGATGYGTIPNTYSGTNTSVNWGNGFRGGGWDGNGFVEYGEVNSNITLYVQYQD